MANLFFPQLACGAIAQYPIRKTKSIRTIKNILPSGDILSFPDPSATHTEVELSYTGLSSTDCNALQAFYTACLGPLRPFTFIDPTGNLLSYSQDISSSSWSRSSLIEVAIGIVDPLGGNSGFSVVNRGQAALELTQTLAIPGEFQYCFSVYLASTPASSVTLIRRGASSDANVDVAVGNNWTRASHSGRLSETSPIVTFGIRLNPGQQIQMFGPQVEAQIAPSRYRPTVIGGSIYNNAHWGITELSVSADGPESFSTIAVIEFPS